MVASLPEPIIQQLLQQNAMLRRQVGVPGLWGPNGRLMAAGTAGGFLPVKSLTGASN